MKLKPQNAADIKRMLPLLRSIAIEIQERTAAVAQLEARLAVPRSAHRRYAVDAGDLSIRLGVHRRELRRAKEELRPLGWRVVRAEATRLILVGATFLLDVGWEFEIRSTTDRTSEATSQLKAG